MFSDRDIRQNRTATHQLYLLSWDDFDYQPVHVDIEPVVNGGGPFRVYRAWSTTFTEGIHIHATPKQIRRIKNLRRAILQLHPSPTEVSPQFQLAPLASLTDLFIKIDSSLCTSRPQQGEQWATLHGRMTLQSRNKRATQHNQWKLSLSRKQKVVVLTRLAQTMDPPAFPPQNNGLLSQIDPQSQSANETSRHLIMLEPSSVVAVPPKNGPTRKYTFKRIHAQSLPDGLTFQAKPSDQVLVRAGSALVLEFTADEESPFKLWERPHENGRHASWLSIDIIVMVGREGFPPKAPFMVNYIDTPIYLLSFQYSPTFTPETSTSPPKQLSKKKFRIRISGYGRLIPSEAEWIVPDTLTVELLTAPTRSPGIAEPMNSNKHPDNLERSDPELGQTDVRAPRLSPEERLNARNKNDLRSIARALKRGRVFHFDHDRHDSLRYIVDRYLDYDRAIEFKRTGLADINDLPEDDSIGSGSESGRPGRLRPGPPQIRTCGIPASGSSASGIR